MVPSRVQVTPGAAFERYTMSTFKMTLIASAAVLAAVHPAGAQNTTDGNQRNVPDIHELRAAYHVMQSSAAYGGQGIRSASPQFGRVTACGTSGRANQAFQASKWWEYGYELSECIRLYADLNLPDFIVTAYIIYYRMLGEAVAAHGSPAGEAMIYEAVAYAVSIGSFMQSGGTWR